jgi:anti-anti-sigma regulatory factor
MELRIDIASEGPVTMVHLTGRLSGNTISQLKEACDQIKGAVVLELSNLRSVDTTGSGFIRTLVEKGTKLRGASPFIQLLLDDEYRG